MEYSPEDWRLAAHHEAGHAIAADGHEHKVYLIDIHPEYGLTSFEEAEGEDFAFIVYAGPWAQARADCAEETKNNETLDDRFADRVAVMFERNRDDWCVYEQVMGGDVDAVKGYFDERDRAFEEKRDCAAEPPPITARGTAWTGWHAKLRSAWPEIQGLAGQMLARKPVITVGGNNVPFDRVQPARWQRHGWTPTDDARITTLERVH